MLQNNSNTSKKVPPVLELIKNNIVKYANPLGLTPRENSSWVGDLNLPPKGELLFYPGGEYQLLPYLDSLTKTLKYLNPSGRPFSWLMGARKLVNLTGIKAEKIYASLLARDKKRYFSINYKAAFILKKLGYDICYNKKSELYSGALLYELGFWEELKDYALKLVEIIKESEAKTVVCLSPHSGEMFKQVYPKLLDFKIEVKTFVELVWDKKELLPIGDGIPIVFHDSCRFARELGLSKEFRDVLEKVGAQPREPIRNGVWTTCCGGPGKMLFPEIAEQVSKNRVKELKDTGAKLILTSCPYCLASFQNSLKKDSGIQLLDFIEFLYERLVTNNEL
ncbi:MAG: (Fe-S)-binding protein [Desulfitobacteriia bacterium]|jgi:Fe-S oxidoreductase